MKSRMMIKNEFGTKTVVWFGSIGVQPELDKEGNQTGKTKGIFVNSNKDSYISGKEGVANSLEQRLSVIKGELWYNVNAGLPLFDKNKKRGVIDSYVVTTIMKHPEVDSIISFKSEMTSQHEYSCNLKILTIHGLIEMSI